MYITVHFDDGSLANRVWLQMFCQNHKIFISPPSNVIIYFFLQSNIIYLLCGVVQHEFMLHSGQCSFKSKIKIRPLLAGIFHIQMLKCRGPDALFVSVCCGEIVKQLKQFSVQTFYVIPNNAQTVLKTKHKNILCIP